ncbi:MAG TPA: hypothetical protein VD772_00490, partial [Anseongella sp.]|nr:hypothetical protein [Anseongella sp.]
MRTIADIPHPRCKISVFYMNGKYIVKVEKSNLEQTFKIPETDLFTGANDIPALFNETMINRILERFSEMEK